jgi:CheY-like chemotaxis protein
MIKPQPFTILNVEPQSAPRFMAGSALRSAGFKVMDATSEEQALQLAASHPDLILLPLGLHEIDGMQVCQRIKTQPSTAKIPVLCLLSETCGTDWRERGVEVCGDAYLTAPVNPGELLHTVQTLLLSTAKWQQKAAVTKGRNITLLCIDDSPVGLEVRRGMLEGSGYTVLTADTGAAGLEVFSKHKVDAVILDYNMPDMNGERVAIELRRMNPRVPILLFSAYADAIPRSLLAAIDAFVAKGQHPLVLLDIVEQLLSPITKKRPDSAVGQTDSSSQAGG